MLTKVIDEFSPELLAVEIKIQKILKKSTGNLLDLAKCFPLNKDKRFWVPSLCFLSAKATKDINSKTNQISAILYLLSYAIYFHWSLPRETEWTDLKREIQHPILAGDLLYGQVYSGLYQQGMKQYVKILTSLISTIQEELILKDIQEHDRNNDKSHDIKIYAKMAENACFLGAHAAAGNTFITDKMGELGYHLGMLKFVWENRIDISCYMSSWNSCWQLLDYLPRVAEIARFQHILLDLGGKWGLKDPVFMQERIV